MDSPDTTQREAPAAEADLLGGEARNSGTMEGLRPQEQGPAARRREDAPADGQARPGEDENQAGFLKETDGNTRP